MKIPGINGNKETWIVILLCLIKVSTCEDESLPTCFSDIYCHGRLLETIQMAKIYNDSKTFVDMKMKYLPNETMQYFNDFMSSTNDKPNRTEVEGFVNKYFESAGQEFEDWIPSDWKPHPKFVDDVKDPEFKQWMLDLNDKWKILGRKMKQEVKEKPDLYSIIYVPHPVIVPGGRFREYYYWDSYWIVQGLLLSEMDETARGLIENFLFIVENYGHIPNGGRVYYLARSQPPLMIPMIKLYYDFTHNTTFISENIHLMEKEFDYWITNHSKTVTKDGVNYTLAIYGDKSKGPRPESYSEDVESAQIFKDDPKKEEFYSEIKAAAESGWDFSSRWFIVNASNKGNLTDIKTRSIVPVDLNAMIYWNAKLLSEFNQLLNNTEKANKYNSIAATWMKAVTAVLWHEEIGAWLDYDLFNEVKRDYFYPTNIAPLWTGCYNTTEKDNIVRSVLKYLQNKNILYPGGVPTTLEHTNEQWDYPNAWPPLQHMMIVGLNSTGHDYAIRLAYEIAETWVRSNFIAFKRTNSMFEKYDAAVPGGTGTGGEYAVQEGFGWTNGVIMDLVSRYANELTADDALPTEEPGTTDAPGASSSITSIMTALIALLVSLTAGFIGIIIYKRRSQRQLLLNGRKRPYTARYTELRNISKHGRNAR